ncbi:MAG TPA: erythromycin esterase family protein [Chloroflexia bacterium]|nr:erythromycin esterase family protein [Chloroflexia bacterium]
MRKHGTARVVAAIGIMFLLAVPGGYLQAAHAQPSGVSRTFPETGKTVQGLFLQYWLSHGGLPQQGYPISEEMQEKSDTDGKTYTVQYFERAVFEYHPENQPPYNVLLSLLGNFEYKRKYQAGAGPAPGQQPNTSPGSVLFPETGKRLGGKFLDYWQAHGELAQQGLPISDEFEEVSELDGKTYTVQYFERAVFELHPENAGSPYEVLLSQLGRFQYDRRYNVAPKPTTTTAPLPLPTSTPVPAATPDAGVVAWLRERAVPFTTSDPVDDYSDLMPLKQMIGDARIVSLGEATHGTHEFFTMKHRMLRFLVKEMGFSVFALEDQWAEIERVNSYVQSGKGTAQQAVESIPFKFPWQTGEMLDMIKWMRAHNEAPGNSPQVSFRGFDMQFPALPMKNVELYVQRVDPPALARTIELNNCFRPYVYEFLEYKKLPQAERDRCRANLQQLYDELSSRQATYEAATSPQEFAAALHSARIVQQAEECNSGPSCPTRDSAMSENITWLLDQAGPGAKIVVWAHNQHIGTHEEVEPGYHWKSMGRHLRDKYGEQMVVFGFDFYFGAFNAVTVDLATQIFGRMTSHDAGLPPGDSYEHYFGAVGLPRFFLYMRGVQPGSPPADWLLGPHPYRSIGAAYDPTRPDAFFGNASLPALYDIVIFMRDTSPSKLLPFT